MVHDFLVSIRGADRVFLEMADLWPDADIFTPVYDEDGMEGRLAGRRVHTSFLQRLRPSARTFRAMLPLYPAAIESFDLTDYDLVVSSSSAWAHAVICGEETVHVCYCHNPFRYAWNERHHTLDRWDPPSFRVGEEHVFLGKEIQEARDFSEGTAEVIDEEVQKLLREADERAYELLEKHRHDLDRLVEALLQREELQREEIEQILKEDHTPTADGRPTDAVFAPGSTK